MTDNADKANTTKLDNLQAFPIGGLTRRVCNSNGVSDGFH
jgi:hypothetical protein